MITSRTKVVVFGLVASLALVVGLLPASASPVVEYETVYNADIAWAGVGGMKDQVTGSIELTGVNGPVTRALLFWQGPSNIGDDSANADVTFDGNPITGTSLGVSDSNCWDQEPYSWAYRADVTSYVTGDGTYSVGDFVTTNGISLVVFHDDGDPSNDRDVTIFNGNDSDRQFAGPPVDPGGWDVTLTGIDYTSGDVSLDLIVADGQPGPDGAVLVNGEEIAPAGSIFSGDTVPDAGFGQSLWDQARFDVTSVMTPGENTLQITHDLGGDCLALIVAMVNMPAGSAPGSSRPVDDLPQEMTTPATEPSAPTFTG